MSPTSLHRTRHLLLFLIFTSTAALLFVPTRSHAQPAPARDTEAASAEAKKRSSPLEIEIVVSEMLSLFYFAEAVARLPSRSMYLWERYEAYRGELDVASDLRESFDAVAGSLRFHEAGEEVPEARFNGQNILDVLEVMAMQSRDLEDFADRSRPMMPIAAHAKMMEALRALAPLHEERIWKPGKTFLARSRVELEKARAAYKMEALIQRIGHFYGADWPAGEPITIGLVPVPGKRPRSVSFAHSAGAFEIVEVMEEDDIDSRFGVLVHELCHSLYQAQPPATQRAEFARFHAPKTLSAHLASLEINEAVATAIGNGWVEADIQGRDVKDELWYADPVIDAYAKAIYPDIKRYLEANKVWDDALTDIMVARFKETFPAAHKSPLFVFQEISLIVDADHAFAHERATRAIFRRAGSTHYSRPAGHPLSRQAYDNTQGYTVLFLLGRRDTSQLSKYPFHAKHKKSLDAALKAKKPFIYATRDVPDQRLHLFIAPGEAADMRAVYAWIAAMKELPLDAITPITP